MAPTPLSVSAHEDAASVRGENELLRAENLRLRAAVSATRPDTPDDPARPSTPQSSAGGGAALVAADQLVHLMREGNQLLQEREALRLEKEALELELGESGEADVAGLHAAGKLTTGDASEVVEDGDLAMVDRLMPLLSEADALRMERESLRNDRKDLISELEAMGETAAAEEAALEADTASDQELEQRFRLAVEDASRENANLEAEIQKLREENARLRSKGTSTPAGEVGGQRQRCDGARDVDSVCAQEPTYKIVSPSRRAMRSAKCQPNSIAVPEEEDFDPTSLQREAMASVLRKQSQVTSPATSRSNATSRSISPKLKKTDISNFQEEALKGALHTLFQNFGRR